MELFEIGQQHSPNLIIVNDLYSVFPATLLSINLRIPLVVVYHETPMPPKKFIGRMPELPLTELALSKLIFSCLPYTLLVAPSRRFFEWALHCGANPKNIILHYFGVNRSRFSPDGAEADLVEYGISPYTPLILMASRVVPRKRIEDILKAIPIIKSEVPNAKFVFTWADEESPKEYLQHIENIINKMDLSKTVICLKNVTDSQMPLLYRRADICLLCSESEGLGMTLIEAQSCGTAVVGPDVSGINEVIKHNINGLLYKFGDINELARCVVNLLNDNQLRIHLSKGGLASIDTYFNQSKQMAILFDKLHTLINKSIE